MSSGKTTQAHRVDTATGLMADARFCESPNADDRPDATTVDTLILHSISLPPGDYGGPEIEDLFMNRLNPDDHPYFATLSGLEVSAHLLLRRDGELLQFVPFHRRAWHAGLSHFRGRTRCNDFSIGIEIEGSDDEAYTDEQYVVLPRLVTALLQAYPALTPRRIAAHSDISPGRKTDPGPAFDWLRLYDGLRTAVESKKACT
ncbi:MAG: 1,6-anhydro-N-acetylmuramyl-L-alanine amidase AmpD [Pseudomonadota bacterium]